MTTNEVAVAPIEAAQAREDDPRDWRRWWVYQRERFPLLGHGPLVAAFSFCAVAHSARLRGAGWPDIGSWLVAFISCLLFFLQLRIADEFKDHAEDCAHRPYRAVPRGLVSLKELGAVFALAAAIQLGLALWWSPWQALVLLAAWLYLAAMSCEFGCHKWLTAHPITYLWTHMLIMPIVDFYAMASDWMPTAGSPPHGLWAFLIASFANGIVIEIGRKIRVPSAEESGVPTYSKLWGPVTATWLWWISLIISATFATISAIPLGVSLPLACIYGCGALLALGSGLHFMYKSLKNTQHPKHLRSGKRFETAAALWTILLYVGLGLLPNILQ